jgi:glycosyltransferase involved in cell wall biosynthesis
VTIEGRRESTVTIKTLYIRHVQHGKGGGWVHASEFTRAATQIGYEVATYPLPTQKPEQVGAKAREGKAYRGGILKEARHLGASLLKKLPGEWRAVKRNKPDVILLRFSHYLSSVLLCRLYRLPLVIEVNAPIVEESKLLPPGGRFKLDALWNSYFSYMLRKASHVIAVSEPLRQHLVEKGLPAGHVTAVPNGVDTKAFAPSSMARKMRNDLGIDGKVVLGFSGFFAPWHGIDFALDGLRQLTGTSGGDAGDPVVLLLVGKAQAYMSMPSFSPSSIVTTGYVDHGEMPSYLDAIDIFIAPYPKIDPFYFSPLKILEAMSMGKPVVASEQGQIRELISHGDNGLLYPPGDMSSFLECLRKLIADRNLREKMGRRGREVAEGRYTWEHNARAILSVCEKVVRKER